MKNASKLVFLLLISILSLGCKKQTVNLNEEFTLDFNKTATVKMDGEKVTVKFTKLVDDSRCQPNQQCFWAGEVRVKIQLDGSQEFTLGLLSVDTPSSVEYKNRTFNLLEVKYNKTENFGKENHCSIRLKVE